MVPNEVWLIWDAPFKILNLSLNIGFGSKWYSYNFEFKIIYIFVISLISESVGLTTQVNIFLNCFKTNWYHLDLVVVAIPFHYIKMEYVLNRLALFSIAMDLLCCLCALANDTGWPAVGKTNTGLKPPERRDSGTDTQGKSSPSGSPVTPSSEKVSFMAHVQYMYHLFVRHTFFFPNFGCF